MTAATTPWPLPRWAHVPGATAGADHDPLDASKRTVPARLAGTAAAGHPAVCYGIALYDAGFHWEAHEVLEAVWLATPHNTRDRSALRAMIQLANAALKLRMGRPRAARRLLAEARSLFAEAGSSGGGQTLAGRLGGAALAAEIATLLDGQDDMAGRLPRLGERLPRMQENA